MTDWKSIVSEKDMMKFRRLVKAGIDAKIRMGS